MIYSLALDIRTQRDSAPPLHGGMPSVGGVEDQVSKILLLSSRPKRAVNPWSAGTASSQVELSDILKLGFRSPLHLQCRYSPNVTHFNNKARRDTDPFSVEVDKVWVMYASENRFKTKKILKSYCAASFYSRTGWVPGGR